MKISPINIFKSNICLKGKTFTPKTEQNDRTETQNQNKKSIPKELAAIQALNGIGLHPKTNLTPDELALYVEHSINSGLEDKLLEYHKIILDAHKQNKSKSSFEFTDEKGTRYNAMHNFYTKDSNFYTIQLEQNYDGIPYDVNIYYKGYPNGKRPNSNMQTGFIYPHTYAGEIEYLNYELRDFNLDDEHGYTDAIIKADGTILNITTGYDMLISPIKTKYNYKNGELLSADFMVYRSDIFKGKNARCIFDENRKVQEIHYAKTKDKDGTIIPGKIYIKNEDGKFILKTNE